MQRLDFAGSLSPSLAEIEEIPNRPHSDQARHRYAAGVFSKLRKRDPDWADVGFRLLGRTAARPDDGDFVFYWGTWWDHLSEILESTLTGAEGDDEFARTVFE